MEQSSETLLAHQLNQLTNLYALLEKEKEVLLHHSPDDLIEITQQKNTLLLSVEDVDKQISQQPNFAEEKSSGLHQEILNNIANTLMQCQELNTVNGLIIQQSQIAVERMKTSLLANNNRSSMTYDNKGKTSGTLKSLGIKA